MQPHDALQHRKTTGACRTLQCSCCISAMPRLSSRSGPATHTSIAVLHAGMLHLGGRSKQWLLMFRTHLGCVYCDSEFTHALLKVRAALGFAIREAHLMMMFTAAGHHFLNSCESTCGAMLTNVSVGKRKLKLM